MKQENSNKLRTVALRIMPALAAAFSLIFSLAAPAVASGFDYTDYIFVQKDDAIISSLPTSATAWLLCGYPSMDELATDSNPAEFTVDHSQIFLDTSYALVCSPFGTVGLDVSDIPNGSELSFEFDINVDQPEDSYGSVLCQVTVYYWSADDQILSNQSYDLGRGFSVEGFVFDDFVVDKPAGADHMTIQFYFLGFDLVNYAAGTTVTFSLDQITLNLIPGSTVTSTGNVDIYDYSGSEEVFSVGDVKFPCKVYVVENGLQFTNADSDVVTYFYEFGGTGPFAGVSVIPNDKSIRYPVGYSFTLYSECSLYLMLDYDVSGYIDIYDYSGTDEIFTIDSVKFPCKVYVAKDGLQFTYSDSDVVSYSYPFGGTGTFIGVSLIPYDKEVRYPVGYTFTLYGDDKLYLIIEGSIPKVDIVDPDAPPGDAEDIVDGAIDVDNSTVNDFWLNLMYELDIPYANTLALFWESQLLHNLLLMAALFALFSFILFGKKG